MIGADPALAGDELIVAPFVAIAQERSSGERIREGRDASASRLVVTPGVALAARTSEAVFTARAALSAATGSADRDLDASYRDLELALTRRFGERFEATLGGSFLRQDAVDPLDEEERALREGRTPELSAGRPDQRDRSGVLGLRYLVSPSASVRLALRASERDYTGAEALRARSRSVERKAWLLEYERRVTPLDLVGVTLQSERLSFDTLAATSTFLRRDAQRERVSAALARWQRQLAPAWQSALTAGARRLVSRGGELREGSSLLQRQASDDRSTGFIGSLELVRATDDSRTQLRYDRELRPSGGLGTSLEIDTFSLQHRRALLPKLTLDLRALLQRSDSVIDAVSDLRCVGTAAAPLLESACRASGASEPMLTRGAGGIDARLVRFGGRLNWRVTPGLSTFLSFVYSGQDSGGLLRERDRDTARIRIGLEYGYDLELF